ncbi:glycosyltransferase family 2 protein [Tatumella citrea]|nr:glycosyltransferase [Tatumella citrea]
MTIELSIIVPCYNVGMYIEECLSSVLRYMDDTAELIIVNDGSTDDTREKIVTTIAGYQNKKIHIIDQENKGISAARNAGLNASSGAWVSFLDSDDSYTEYFFDIFNKKIKHSSADLVEFDANIIRNTGSPEYFSCSSLPTENVNGGETDSLIPVFRQAKWFTWSRIYKRSLLTNNNIQFPEGLIYEDIAAIPLCYLSSSSVARIKIPLVNYRVREGSLSTHVNSKDINDLIAVMEIYKSLKTRYSRRQHPLLALVMEKCFKRIKELAGKNQFHLSDKQLHTVRSCLLAYLRNYSLSKKIKFMFIRLYMQSAVYRRAK